MAKRKASGEDDSTAKIQQLIRDCRYVANSPPLPADTPQSAKEFADRIRMLIAALGELASAVLAARGEVGRRTLAKGSKPR